MTLEIALGNRSSAGETFIYTDAVTSNMSRMAKAVGIYEPLWNAREIGIRRAGDLVHVLTDSIAWMEREPDRFRKYNPRNGHGNYGEFLDFLKRVRNQCEQYPDAVFRIWK